jgi:two-component system, NtrC family, sensor kinase
LSDRVQRVRVPHFLITSIGAVFEPWRISTATSRPWPIWRSSVPLMREGVSIGSISLRRTEAQLFTQRQVALLETFADQAVIAIENTRLFEEVQARTKELQESLRQQAGTADVLKTISRSAFDLQRVLDTLTEAAARLGGADKGLIRRREGDHYVLASTYGFSDEFKQWVASTVLPAG